MTHTQRRTPAIGSFVAAVVFAVLASTVAGTASATELIPSFGVSKSTDANAGNATGFAGVSLRKNLFPFLKLEGGIGYRQDSFGGPALKVRQWPVTASLWVPLLPAVYAGGGLGWYRTTLDYASNLTLKDSTTDKLGVHIGGGVQLPLAPKLGLDLNGRYIFMQTDKTHPQLPTTFNPDYWTTSLGLAFKF